MAGGATAVSAPLHGILLTGVFRYAVSNARPCRWRADHCCLSKHTRGESVLGDGTSVAYASAALTAVWLRMPSLSLLSARYLSCVSGPAAHRGALCRRRQEEMQSSTRPALRARQAATDPPSSQWRCALIGQLVPLRGCFLRNGRRFAFTCQWQCQAAACVFPIVTALHCVLHALLRSAG